jgi:hypothetical protein
MFIVLPTIEGICDLHSEIILHDLVKEPDRLGFVAVGRNGRLPAVRMLKTDM